MSKTKIAVNTRLLLKNKLEGIGWFTYESFKRIVTTHSEIEFHFIFDRKWDDDFIFSENVIPHYIYPPARHPSLIYLWYEYSLPFVLNKINPDLFISPDALTSIKANVKKLTVIHDINFEHYPEQMPKLYAKMYRYYTPRIAAISDRIATVSNFSKQDIINYYGVSSDKIDVVYNGSNTVFTPVNKEKQLSVKCKYSGGEDYFVYVGALNPRKNLQNQFKAFDLYKNNTAAKTKYLIVGEKMYWSEEIKDAYNSMKYKDDVVFLGRLMPEELNDVLGSAIALTYVSLFEGFGIPIIEAFSAGTSVITSKTSSMPEVAGDAALLVDPFDVKEIANAMKLLAVNQDLRRRLIDKGRKRKNAFSWDKTAVNLWKSIEKVL
jgi:glycosyltransferase involved in cell wall biosynthesis